MITRVFNLILASGLALLIFRALFAGDGDFDWTTVLFPVVAICWLAGAIGLFFRSRLAWCGSLLGVGTMAASSLTMFLTGCRLAPVSTDPSDGAGYMLIFGFFGLLLSLPVIVGLIRNRKICFSATT